MGAARRILVIGAGVNGLVAACRLARAGHEVSVLERRAVAGGLAARETFHPGYRAPGLLHDTGLLRDRVVDVLGLAGHGLRRRPREAPVLVAAPGGEVLSLPLEAPLDAPEGDGPMVDALAPHAPADAEAWPAWRDQLRRLTPVVRRLLDRPPPPTEALGWRERLDLAATGLAVRRLGRRDMAALMRIGPMCLADFIREWFRSPPLGAALSLPALEGTWSGPWSAGTAALLLLRESVRGPSVCGGPAAVADAVLAAAREAGVRLLLEHEVRRLRLDGNAATGVELADGRTMPADLVASAADPITTLLGLVPRRRLPVDVASRARRWRVRGTTAVVRLALDGRLAVRAPGEAPVETLRVAESLDDVERAFDAVKYGALPDAPVLDVRCPAHDDPGLAPEGHDVVTISAHFVPRALDGAWNDRRREELADLVLRRLEEAAPGTRRRVRARQVLSPADLEARLGLAGGHVHHGEHALDQLLHLRPMPACARYATPIDGLFLCGSGSHPGGGVTGLPGLLAAEAILESLGEA